MSDNRFDLSYFYDGQIRRMNIQFTRIFTNFHYSIGKNRNGEPLLRRVPARYASTNRQVAYVLRNNSENVMLSVPMFTVYLTGLTYDRNRVQDPLFSEKIRFNEKKFDSISGEFIQEPGQRFTVERYMPVPYTMRWNVDLWVSNESQKEQLVEQIIVLFNPSIQLQFTENPLDWTSLTELTLEEINWSNNSIPIGTGGEIEIITFTFSAPVWINPPAIVERQKIIKTIITNVLEAEKYEDYETEASYGVQFDKIDLLSRTVTTFNDHTIVINQNVVKLTGPGGIEVNENGKPFSWKTIFSKCGGFRPGITQLVINPTDNIEDEEHLISGILDYGSSENELLWFPNPSTLPLNTIREINAIIDPVKTFPERGLSIPVIGTRYLLLSDIGNSIAWGNIQAKKHEIIEWDGSKWVVAFNVELEKEKIHYVKNLYDNNQLIWNGKEWKYLVNGLYEQGFWRIIL